MHGIARVGSQRIRDYDVGGSKLETISRRHVLLVCAATLLLVGCAGAPAKLDTAVSEGNMTIGAWKLSAAGILRQRDTGVS